MLDLRCDGQGFHRKFCNNILCNLLIIENSTDLHIHIRAWTVNADVAYLTPAAETLRHGRAIKPKLAGVSSVALLKPSCVHEQD